MRILIIEDNRRLAESIRDILRHRYDCDLCGDGAMGEGLLLAGGYDAAILDLMLPGKDGISVLKEIRRKKCQIPVLILTARGEVEDRVCGLESGADYYLTKPFDMQELQAVMKTILRRQADLVPECLTCGNISLNQADYSLGGPGRSIPLGKKEYEIMRILMANQGRVVSKETLLLRVWGDSRDAVENNAEVYISFLRKKLQFLKADVAIVTSRKLGYRLCGIGGPQGKEEGR